MLSYETDLLPEDITWRDEGCQLYPACLNCPLPRCIEDESRGKQRLKKIAMAIRMAELKRSGKSLEEIASAFAVSKRTVQRALTTLQDYRRSTQ